jgi:hypothetical protein
MIMKGQEGGPLGLPAAYGRIIVAIVIIVFLLAMFITYINSHPEWGITLPEIFGGPGG